MDSRGFDTVNLRNSSVGSLEDIPIRADVFKGYALIFIFFGGLIAWAMSMSLASASIASGKVFTEGNRKQIQHLNGGVVREIYMVEGQTVKRGDVLLRLEDNAAKTRHDNARSRLVVALARAARLDAEVNKSQTINFSKWLYSQSHDDEVERAMRSQLQVFNTRLASSSDKKDILRIKIEQTQAQVSGDIRRLHATDTQLVLVKQELTSYQRLVKQQLVTKSKLYSLESQQQSLHAERALIHSAITNSRKQKAQHQAELAQLNTESRKVAAEELEKLEGEILVLQQTLAGEENIIGDTEVRSPIDGVIVGMSVHTSGGVIQGGQVLAEIVPDNGKLMLLAEIDPKDRDAVKIGQAAEIRFSAFNQRSSQPLQGKIVMISADSIVSSGSQAQVYQAHVEMLDDPNELVGQGAIFPGMQAEVMILTGERTALEYIFEPIARSFNRSLREE